MILPLILASSSPARQQVMRQAQLSFSCITPDLDETARPDEGPSTLVSRLSLEKAQAIAQKIDSSALIIGSDQVAYFEGEILGKPHQVERQATWLRAFSGKALTYYSGITLLDTAQGVSKTEVITTTATFRTLTEEDISAYVQHADALSCAGGLKVEGLGILLMSELSAGDPTAIIGLSLITVSRLMRTLNHNIWSYVG
ncbi:MAG: Maf family nucleotide pyrophosphatase [Pseudomonadota bacterium]